MNDAAPNVPIKPVRRSLRERFSVVWLIPLVALLIALGVAWTSYSERGPLVIIAFDSASGVKAGETELRYRDITVGLVEKVTFSPSLEKVEVLVRLDKDIEEYVDGDAKFWVVRPEVSARGITGLDTVLSGVFIEGLWDTTPFGFVAYHEGLADAPLLRVGETGRQIVLRATENTTLAENTPILFKGITVGRTGKPRLVGDGTESVADAVIYSPHDTLISSSTRFWDISGFAFKIGAGGAELDFSSLASLISGGVTFETVVSGGVAVADGYTFEVYEDEPTARSSVFSDSSGPPLEVSVIFSENVSGLAAGAPVELAGVRIGEVKGLRGLVDEARFGDTRVRLLASLSIRPERLGLGDAITPDEALEFLADRVREGLRARLATASILTGGLKIELLLLTNASPAEIERPADAAPIIPSTLANIKDVAATAEGVLKRVNELPIEEMLANVVSFLESAKNLIGNEELQRAPAEIVGLIEEARGVIGSEQVQALPEGINTLMTSLTGATEDLRVVLEKLNEADAVNRLMAAVDSAGTAAAGVGTSMEGVPDLIAKIDALAAKATALPVEDLLAQATELATSAQGILGSDSAQALPENVNTLLTSLTGTTDELQTVLTQIKEADTINRLLAAIDSAGIAATEVGTSLQGVPDLITKIDALAAKATALPVENLISEATGLVTSARELVASDGTKALPATLNAALQDLQNVIADISGQDGVARLLATIDAAGVAAADVGTSLQGVPDLITKIDALAAKATELPLENLVTEATGLVTSAQELLAADTTKQLPGNLNAALQNLQGVITEITDQNGIARLLATIDEAGKAATTASASFEGVPALVEQISAVAATANELPLDQLITELTAVVDSANVILGTDGAKQLPESLNAALAQIEAVLAELRAGGTVQNVNSTLASTANAANAVARASEDLPGLVRRVNGLINQAATTLASFDGKSAINRDIRAALLEVQRAAASVASLTRALERRPNSIILGR